MNLSRLHGADRDYFDTLVRDHGPLVYGVVRTWANDPADADDLYQKTWMTAWINRKTFTGRGTFRSWLYQVAINVCRSHMRSESARRKRWEKWASHVETSATMDPLTRVDLREELESLRWAMSRLPDRQQQVLILTYVEGRTSAEVAEGLGIKPASVRSHLRHALHAIRATLKEGNEDLSRFRSTG